MGKQFSESPALLLLVIRVGALKQLIGVQAHTVARGLIRDAIAVYALLAAVIVIQGVVGTKEAFGKVVQQYAVLWAECITAIATGLVSAMPFV